MSDQWLTSSEWLESLDEQARADVEQRVAQMEALGCRDALEWVRSEIEEDVPQLARFLLLRSLWRDVDMWGDLGHTSEGFIRDAERNPGGSFADAGMALKRMLELGVDPADIGRLARMVAYESAFTVLERIDSGYDYEAGQGLPGWVLMETDPEGEPSGRPVDGLHESFLSLDPSGREGRPE